MNNIPRKTRPKPVAKTPPASQAQKRPPAKTIPLKRKKPVTGASEQNGAFEFVKAKPNGSREARKVINRPKYYRHLIDRNLISVLKPYSFETEMFKVLRGKITHPLEGEPPRSILITSAVPGEGKSFVAANLAVTLAQYITDYVLLLDCDLRKPTIHTRFGFQNVPGLSEYLAGKLPLPPLLLKTMVKKLSILAAGKPPYNPSEILSSPKMTDLLHELQTRYDDRWLIIDSPPPHLAPETLAIAQEVDAVIIVVKHQSTPQALVKELIASFEPEKILGAVINRFDIRTSRYYGYGRYRTYKKYYHQVHDQ